MSCPLLKRCSNSPPALLPVIRSALVHVQDGAGVGLVDPKTASDRKAEDAEVAFVDTPVVLTDNLKDIVAGAGVVVVPVRPTPNDIEPFTCTVSIVAKNTKAPVVIVVNGWNRFRMCASVHAMAGQEAVG